MSRNGIIAVVGATGVVGREALSILSSHGVPSGSVRALASGRSAGGAAGYGAGTIPLGLATPEALRGAAIVLLCASAEVSRALAPAAVEAGAIVIDNSAAYRLDPRVPLVVPEINGHLAANATLIANPNCSAVILLVALEPLRRAFGVRAIDVATYQAVSGAGQGGIDDLLAQTDAIARGTTRAPAHFREPCALNVFSHDSDVDPASGLNGEERKIIDESRKVWNDANLRVTPACVRVPVLRAHTLAVTVELAVPAGEHEVRAALAGGEGLTILDDREANAFPTPLKAAGLDGVLIGRIRPDPGEPANARGEHRRWCLLACGDQLRKGAAGNAIQIARRTGRLAWIGENARAQNEQGAPATTFRSASTSP